MRKFFFICLSAMTLQAAEKQSAALQELQAAAVVRFVLPHKPDEDEESVEIKRSILECCNAFKNIINELEIPLDQQEAVPLPDIIEPRSLDDLNTYVQDYLHKADSSEEALEGLSTYVKTFKRRGSNEWILRVYNLLVTVNYFDVHYQDYEGERLGQEHAIVREELVKKQDTFSRQRNKILGHEIASVLLDPVLIQDIDSVLINKMFITPYEYYIQQALQWLSIFCERTLTGDDGHTGWIMSVAWNSDGTKIVSGSDDRTIKIWDAITGACLITLTGNDGHSSSVNSVTWNSDSTKIISGSSDKTIKIWDAIAGVCLMTLIDNDDHDNSVMSVAWNHNSTKIISGSYNAIIKIWDAITGICLKTFTDVKVHNAAVFAVSWSPDDTQIASGSADRTIKIWDAVTGVCLKTLRDVGRYSTWVMSVAWNPDGIKIALGSYGRDIEVWDVKTDICMRILTGIDGHFNCVRSIVWSPDGTKIASGSYDRTIKIWDAITGICLRTLKDDDGLLVMSIAWSPDGTKIISGSADNTIKIWTISELGLEGYNMWLAKHCPAKLLEWNK